MQPYRRQKTGTACNWFLVPLKEHLIAANVPGLGWIGVGGLKGLVGGFEEIDHTGVGESSN